MRELVRRHRIACFLAITYAVSWGAWLPLALAHRRVGPGLSPAYLAGLLGPMIGAVATRAISDGRTGLRELGARMIRVRVEVRAWAIAIGVPFATYAATYVVLAAYAMFLLAPIVLPSWHSLGMFTGFPITNAAALLVMLVIVNGFGEETGWRGFLQPELQRTHSPVVASLLVAACWAPWHVPAFFVSETYRQMPPATIPMFFVGLASAALFLGWLANRARGSVTVVAVFHGAYNLFAGTVGARGPLATVESTVVIFAAAAIVVRELREPHEHVPPASRLQDAWS
ncbi:MAG: CPBP family intramembrane glutamic endopeptidase [Acidobacteriota bacterium]